jgi:hypothetical protein
MIDTLILSGGGAKGAAYIGVYNYLVEKNLLKNIKNIVSCSIGSFFGVCMSMNINMNIIKHLFMNINSIYDIDNIDLESFQNFGFFENNIFIIIIKHILQHKYNLKQITLKELFDITGINHEIKVYNYTLLKTEYYNHINHPNIDLALIITAATSIPIINQYVNYNGHYLLDGGISGSFPSCNYKYNNYIGIWLDSTHKINTNPDDFLTFLKFIIMQRDGHISSEYLNNKRILKINSKITMFSFDISNDEVDLLIQNGYNSFKKFHETNLKLFKNKKSSKKSSKKPST